MAGAELLLVVGVGLLLVAGAELLGFRGRKKLMCLSCAGCGFFERLVVVSLPRFRVADFFRLLDRFIFLFAGGNERIGHVAAADCS